jgi:hypothetical protein
MAKIIDFKTKQVLADLPSEKTTRGVRIYQAASGILCGKLAIIARDVLQAAELLNIAELARRADDKAS